MIPSRIDIAPLLPTQPIKPKSVVDILPKPNSGNNVNSLLNNMLTIRLAVITLPSNGTQSDEGYEDYLQFPNATIQALASSIVSPTDTNDKKMYRIEQWVQNNITYVSDLENYGVSEMWTYPTVTLNRKTGDCEDGAFLIHSLALHAGVPPERLRTYGGIVFDGQYTASTSGHAWTAYKREIDDMWVITDWCYWAKDTPIAQRTPMSEDYKYIDDYFYVNLTGTTETPYTNAVRYAYMPKGALINMSI